jgi:hypothetical protein
MTQTPITADFHQPLDVHLHSAAQISLHPVFALDDFAQGCDLRLIQVLNPPVWIDARLM